ncbi:MAG: Uma2 family endonuclease [Pseudanabaenales cyanobacterium]|nr:Uma2 family endonuclease [Pseudanabaenales cyanobacterium]
MTQAKPKLKVSFEEYLTYLDRTDTRYELVNGDLAAMNPPTWRHILIARFLERALEAEIQRIGRSWLAVQGAGQRVEEDTSRLPALLVVSVEAIQPTLNQSAVLEEAAILAIEIVSESSTAADYLHKLAEYEMLGIPEYWIVDYLALGASRYIGRPKQPTISIYQLVDGEYQVSQFQGADRLVSPTFPELKLTAEQVLKA